METIIDFLVTEFQIDKNVAVSTVVTLFIFCSGIIINQIIKAITLFNSRRRTRNLFQILIDQLSRSIRLQGRDYGKIADQFTFKSYNRFTYKRAEVYTLDILYDTGYQRLFDAQFLGFENYFQTDKDLKVKAFNKVWETLNIISYWHEKSFEGINDFLKDYNKHNDNRNEAIENHRILLAPIFQALNGQNVNPTLASYLVEIDNITANWQTVADRTRPDIVHRKLILPLRVHNRKHLKSITIALKLNQDLLDASEHYINQRNLLKAQKEQFKTYSMIFRDREKRLQLYKLILSEKIRFDEKSLFKRKMENKK